MWGTVPHPNQGADSAAKSALDLPHAKVGVPYNNFKHCINQYILSTWQDELNSEQASFCQASPSTDGAGRMCHTCIGHTHLTYSYILKKDPPTLCEHCQCILTVCHILVECNHFAQERKNI